MIKRYRTGFSVIRASCTHSGTIFNFVDNMLSATDSLHEFDDDNDGSSGDGGDDGITDDDVNPDHEPMFQSDILNKHTDPSCYVCVGV